MQQLEKLVGCEGLPAAVSQTLTTIEISWANRMLELVFRMFKYCRISGRDKHIVRSHNQDDFSLAR